MAVPSEKALSPEQLKTASSNYLRCLNLPPSSQVLIITDKPTGGIEDNFLTRAYISSSLCREMNKAGNRVAIINFNNSSNFEDFRMQTNQALKELDNKEGVEGFVDDTTTIVYLGEKWENKSGIYQAAEDFGKKKNHNIRLAGSLRFSTGEARVMSELSSEKMKIIYEANKKMNAFFEEKPQGLFEIKTRGIDGEERTLNLSYNTKEASFESDVGQFDEENKVMISEHVQYINIPGGEKFTSPYPFQKTNGEFAAQGVLFNVKNGLLINVAELEVGAFEKIVDPMQKKLIELIKRGEKIPVSELGIGFYSLVGIKTYTDSTILSLEKGGPHIGFAHSPGKTTESETLAEKSKIKTRKVGEPESFYHTDFVMDNPVMMWSDFQGKNRQQFYPPSEE